MNRERYLPRRPGALRFPRPMTFMQTCLWLVYCLGSGLLVGSLSVPLIGVWSMVAGLAFLSLNLCVSYWLCFPHSQCNHLVVDSETSAAYIHLSDRPIARTEELDDSVLVDRDDAGHVVGIEILS